VGLEKLTSNGHDWLMILNNNHMNLLAFYYNEYIYYVKCHKADQLKYRVKNRNKKSGRAYPQMEMTLNKAINDKKDEVSSIGISSLHLI
jgi:hypothetical protein